ncbi:MAG: hypothetical protein BGO97_12420 [Micrococcales bacterium 70-64]|mgnify:CR=1 FL=1|nr:hypothetical protein [Leifsonia sp.]ODU64760.1 MAG: hypothetical protein ABT06_12420 [Leifsonia sp. SCN 70-46]OJX86451.1 MAG: hypothetical protein BGO97_12420 [Micrococcales bacterium 70-64]
MSAAPVAVEKVYSPWIWLVVVLPYVTLPLLFTFDLPGYLRGLDVSDPDASVQLQLQLFTSPALLLLSLSGWVLGAAVVLFSWLDWRWLVRAGVPQPFHWAFGFFSLLGYPVYAIGRAVVTRRRTGRGMAVLWVVIALFALSLVVSIVWAATLVLALVGTLPFS